MGGRCPECGRGVAAMRRAGRLLPAVSQLRRHVRAGGALILLAEGVWVAAVSAERWPSNLVWWIAAAFGPRPTSIVPLPFERPVGRVLAGVAVACYAIGLVMVSAVPAGLLTRGRRLLAWGVRGASVGVVVGAMVALLVRDQHESTAVAAVVAAIADAAALFAVGLHLGRMAAVAGRPGFGLWTLALCLADAAASATAGAALPGGGSSASTEMWVIAVLAGLNVGVNVLLVRFGALPLWSDRRWWAWAGYRCDPDADAV